MVKKEFAKLKEYSDLIFYFVLLFTIDFGMRVQYQTLSLVGLYSILPLFFTLGWCSLFTWIAYMLKGRWRKGFMIFTITFFYLLMIVQHSYFAQFNKFVSIVDVSLLGEASEFAGVSYIRLPLTSIMIGISVLGFFVLLYFHHPKVVKRSRKIYGSLIGIIIVCFMIAQVNVPPSGSTDLWNAANHPGIVYENYTDTTKSLLMSGYYQYTFRDIFLALNPFTKIDQAKEREDVDEYFINQQDAYPKNTHTGMLKGKNVMMIQLENIDNWMVQENVMPNLYKLRTEGIDFVDHYSASFSTGRTFNTEFMVQTGLIPPTKGETPSRVFARNAYPYSLANLFNAEGYTSNSFHQNNGSIYNRAVVHEQLGFQKYYNGASMDIANNQTSLDSLLINGFDEMSAASKYFSFVITLAAHSPFTTSNLACKTHFDEMEANNKYQDESYQCALAQAKETDLFIGELLANLETSGKLKDTALILYADHYAYNALPKDIEYDLKQTDVENLKQNTPFIIWAQDIKAEKVEVITSSIDILPTIANLFHFDVNHKYFLGQDAFSKKGKGYVFFQDGALYNSDLYYDPIKDQDMLVEDAKLKEEIKRANETLQISWKILLSDYFKK